MNIPPDKTPDAPATARCEVERETAPAAKPGGMNPCAVVIFGASGDLTARKLIPSLLDLHRKGALPHPFLVLGCARTDMSHESFRESLREHMEATGADLSQWEDFAGHVFYQPLDYTRQEDFAALEGTLKAFESQHHTGGNRVFYMALPPKLYGPVAERIGAQGMSREKNGKWRRLVVEKPFGRDLDSAVDLARQLHTAFGEDQIFRMDHYLAKETVQNVLMFRFANSIFEPVWNRGYIEYVSITAAEMVGVEHRAGYYEEAGVLRDMFQNHMMQLLSLCAMEPPSLFAPGRVADEKAKVFRSLRPFPIEDLDDWLVLGQYGSGQVNGDKIKAYRDEPGVDGASITPTFAALRVMVDNWRWQGVPFLLASGKRLAKKSTKIVIGFKEVPHSMFRSVLGEHITANTLTMGIQPDEVIDLTFQTKTPGVDDSLRSVTMHFDYNQGYKTAITDSYAKALVDCMEGDHMLFWRQDGVELTWSYFTPIVHKCETCSRRFQRLRFYEPGGWGPPEAKRLLSFNRPGNQKNHHVD